MARTEKIKTPFGHRLTDFRKQLGHAQRPSFCKILGISKVTLGNYERGDREPDLQFLLLYAKNFNANLHWLITGEGDMFDDEAGKRPAPEAQNTEKDILRQAVRAVERGLAGTYLPPSKKAELVELSRALLQTGKAEYLRKLINLLLTTK